MTNHAPASAVRRAALLLALTPALLVTGLTGTAFADAPEQWEDSPSVSPLYSIVVLGLIPLGLFLLIWLLVYLPSMTRGGGHGYHPGEAWRNESEWFGGPRAGVGAVDTAERPPAAGSGEPGSRRGGSSGRW